MAAGVYNTITRTLGAVPGPIILGQLIDNTCIGENCESYNIELMKKTFFRMALGLACLTLFFLIMQRIVWHFQLKRSKQKQGSDLDDHYHLQVDGHSNAKLEIKVSLQDKANPQ